LVRIIIIRIIVIAIDLFGFVFKHLIQFVPQQDIEWAIVRHDSGKFIKVIHIFNGELNVTSCPPDKIK
jgi:hypothetical protein